MIKMQSPEPNRKGVYEIHDVPDRKIQGLKERGWQEVEPQRSESAEIVDFSSEQWFTLRKKIKDLLELDKPPKSKQEGKALLEQAGYTVKE